MQGVLIFSSGSFRLECIGVVKRGGGGGGGV